MSWMAAIQKTERGHVTKWFAALAISAVLVAGCKESSPSEDQTRGLDEPKASKPAPAADRSSMNAGAAGNRALPEGHPPITGGAPTPVE
ncbi:MAG: hypothetical protein KDA33_10350, partial [Phycisphaerales bacterium]|nr:hypothetical protein [Phycisphaerales bacterium]